MNTRGCECEAADNMNHGQILTHTQAHAWPNTHGVPAGDHLRTAISVAHQCGILPPDAPVVVIDAAVTGGSSLATSHASTRPLSAAASAGNLQALAVTGGGGAAGGAVASGAGLLRRLRLHMVQPDGSVGGDLLEGVTAAQAVAAVTAAGITVTAADVVDQEDAAAAVAAQVRLNPENLKWQYGTIVIPLAALAHAPTHVWRLTRAFSPTLPLQVLRERGLYVAVTGKGFERWVPLCVMHC